MIWLIFKFKKHPTYHFRLPQSCWSAMKRSCLFSSFLIIKVITLSCRKWMSHEYCFENRIGPDSWTGLTENRSQFGFLSSETRIMHFFRGWTYKIYRLDIYNRCINSLLLLLNAAANSNQLRYWCIIAVFCRPAKFSYGHANYAIPLPRGQRRGRQTCRQRKTKTTTRTFSLISWVMFNVRKLHRAVVCLFVIKKTSFYCTPYIF